MYATGDKRTLKYLFLAKLVILARASGSVLAAAPKAGAEIPLMSMSA